MTDKELLELALEALQKSIAITMVNIDLRNKAITAIKQALAAPVQDTEAHYKSVVEGVQKLFDDKRAQPAPVEPDWKAEYLKSVESGCITLDELREARAELNATNRQVEILSDALAESRREVAALKAVQEPVALEEYDAGILGCAGGGDVSWWQDYIRSELGSAYEYYQSQITTPPAAKRPWFGLTDGDAGKVIDYVHTNSRYGHHHTGFWMDFYRAIEAKLKEKNT
jgi:hypothetical protein